MIPVGHPTTSSPHHHEETPGTPLNQQGLKIGPNLSDAKAVLLAFVSGHIGARAFGFQSTFGSQPHDLILFEAPIGPGVTSLAVPCSILLLSPELAHDIVAQRIADSQREFGIGI